ncbi:MULTISPECIES: helix-turn-helix transcriptional regulator [unclassified Enterococcus]|uniref:helix-turn-helix domain-containing protein n=1 Tax=unclassified Enterococcus TaxID=2608891 RepID=UPI0015555BE6|nr:MULTISPECIES: helix-turn-helix transcriptional regulator [unclassified Enterococcus]MBS7578326.1 helix-turn-helix transcriptional regulator [Enterococcus sp. MMGLQ5-2]MBS7585563.1 helix-turn-helix transcriptional regulator [Enterococcus sp. MMGLQ5-1]NPD13422.1 helix-turn-helix transcriptional regulator [Enterococcus sp. MMGLQ5-1]NPD38157.1 helix-turn-helix transcriptional regulator [Enterococcus sp. MMGLQ5-2]
MLYENVKNLAFKKGVSIYRVERDLNLSNGVIGKWNTSKPSAENLKKVADYFNVSVEELMEKSDKEV